MRSIRENWDIACSASKMVEDLIPYPPFSYQKVAQKTLLGIFKVGALFILPLFDDSRTTDAGKVQSIQQPPMKCFTDHNKL